MNRCWLLTANCIVKCIPAFRCPQPSGVQNPLAFHYPSWLIETPAFQSWMMMIPQKRGSTILYTIPNARQPNIVYQLSPLSTCISICCSTGLGFHCTLYMYHWNMIGASLRLLSHVPELFIFIHLILSGSVTIPSSMEMCPTTLPPKDYLI